MKWLKYLLFAVAILLVGLVVVSALGAYYLKQVPSFYRTYQWKSESQRSQINQQTVDKIGLAHNLAARLWAAQSAAARRQAKGGLLIPPTTNSADILTLTFTEEELNAFLFHNIKTFGSLMGSVEKVVAEPAIFLNDGKLVLAGRLQGFGESIVSAVLEARLGDDGQLRLALDSCAAGRLPIPKLIINNKLEPALRHLETRQKAWAASAAQDTGGGANGSALALAGNRALVAVLAGQPMPPVVPVPANEKGACYPLSITQLKIDGNTLTVTLSPMTPAAQAEYFRWVVDGK